MTLLLSRKPEERQKPKRKMVVRQVMAHLSHSSLTRRPCLRFCFPLSSLREAFQETPVSVFRTRYSNKPSPLAEGEHAMTFLPSADSLNLMHARHRFPQWFAHPLAHALHHSDVQSRQGTNASGLSNSKKLNKGEGLRDQEPKG
jgi:hypothetical protein